MHGQWGEGLTGPSKENLPTNYYNGKIKKICLGALSICLGSSLLLQTLQRSEKENPAIFSLGLPIQKSLVQIRSSWEPFSHMKS